MDALTLALEEARKAREEERRRREAAAAAQAPLYDLDRFAIDPDRPAADPLGDPEARLRADALYLKGKEAEEERRDRAATAAQEAYWSEKLAADPWAGMAEAAENREAGRAAAEAEMAAAAEVRLREEERALRFDRAFYDREALPPGVAAGEMPEVLAKAENQRDALDIYAWLNKDITHALELVNASGLPPAEEVERYARETGISGYLIGDLLPHAKDLLEARATAKRLLDLYGGDVNALDNSVLMRRIRNPKELHWTVNVEAKAKLEAALLGHRGGVLAENVRRQGDHPEGSLDWLVKPLQLEAAKFADQQLYRAGQGVKEIGKANWSVFNGLAGTAARLASAASRSDRGKQMWDQVSRRLDDFHHTLMAANPTVRLNSGNPKTDWLLDKALIDAPNLYSQIAPYAIFGR
ncbi:MAG: hypothetical protein LBV15_04575, partial [Planctomycetota bacterium]|nr:hypothetical protein [Planctomycetota bacterium]